jgi:DNA-binding response OmpR family regulator
MPGWVVAVVEDDPALLHLMERLLTNEGYEVLLFSNSSKASAEISRRLPHAVILDLWVEDREAGWRLVEDLKSSPRTTTIPLILCSADEAALKERRNKLEQWGCPVLLKPFDIDALLGLLADLLGPKPPEPRP